MLVCVFYILGLLIGYLLGKVVFTKRPSGTLYFKKSSYEDNPELFLVLDDLESITEQREVIFRVSEQEDIPQK